MLNTAFVAFAGMVATYAVARLLEDIVGDTAARWVKTFAIIIVVFCFFVVVNNASMVRD